MSMIGDTTCPPMVTLLSVRFSGSEDVNVTVMVSPSLAKPFVGDDTAVNPLTTGVLSVTVISTVAVPTLPALSVAVHVTVVVPMANVEPEAGTQDTEGEAGFASLADSSVKVITAPAADVASAVWAAGGLTVGAVRSITGPD